MTLCSPQDLFRDPTSTLGHSSQPCGLALQQVSLGDTPSPCPDGWDYDVGDSVPRRLEMGFPGHSRSRMQERALAWPCSPTP